jgi:hypothetical protein
METPFLSLQRLYKIKQNKAKSHPQANPATIPFFSSARKIISGH